MTNIEFEVLIDDSLSNVATIEEFKSVANKSLLSMVNDFEDAKWRFGKFQNFLWDNVAETALSANERKALISQSHTSLVESAKNLRLSDSDVTGEGSEIAEIFLYGVMKNHFGALPVVPKIFYKQNSQDNAKGSDSVHIVVNGNDFTLWFGEAKFYNSIENSRLPSIISSVLNSLKTDKIKKENTIITNVSDLDHLGIPDDIKTKIKEALKPRNSIDDIKHIINVPIMILHECDTTRGAIDLSEEYKKSIRDHHIERGQSYFLKQLSKAIEVHKYEQVSFHLILFPVPEKSQIVQRFTSLASMYKAT